MKVTTNDKIVGIVDDEIDITELFQDALRGNIEGISVVSFNDPSLALEHYIKNKENYALIFSDMRMPTMSGLELLKKVKELNPHVRTILVSAYNMQVNSLFQTYLKEGAIDSVIEKPVTINRFCQKVRDEGQAYQLVLNKQK
jgi:DNA-binding NtrC family response regulator